MMMQDTMGTPASGALETGSPEIRVGGFGSRALVLDPRERPVSPGEEVAWVLEEPGAPCVVCFEEDSLFGELELHPAADGRIRATVVPSPEPGSYLYEVRIADGDSPAPARGLLNVFESVEIPDVPGSGTTVTPPKPVR